MKRTYKYTGLGKCMILVMYLLFFTVQIFFNLDTRSRSFSAYGGVHATHSKTIHGPVIKSAAAKGAFNPKIRLNKRFQPATAQACIATVITVPQSYAPALKLGFYAGDFYSSVLLRAQLLRGPPVVA